MTAVGRFSMNVAQMTKKLWVVLVIVILSDSPVWVALAISFVCHKLGLTWQFDCICIFLNSNILVFSPVEE